MRPHQLCLRTSSFRNKNSSSSSLRTLSSVALGSLSTPKSLIRILLVSFSLGWAALLVQNKSLILSASFAQNESFGSFNSLCFSTFCFTASSPASQRALSAASSMSFSSPASDRASSAASSGSFTHQQAMAVLLNNEAYSLPPALLVTACQPPSWIRSLSRCRSSLMGSFSRTSFRSFRRRA